MPESFKPVPSETADPVPRELSRREAEVSVQEAVEAMGAKNVFGPERAAATFGLSLESLEIPPIPFSRAELERARELGQFLVFRVDKAADGEPMSMRKMSEVLAPRFAKGNKGEVFNPDDDWFEESPFFTDEVPAAGWALVSGEAVPGTTEKNFLEQTEELIRYLREDAFGGAELSQKYVDAIAKFDAAKAGIAAIISTNREKASEQLEALAITFLLRPSPAEAAYDAMLVFDQTGVRHLSDGETWTSRRSTSDSFVCLRGFDSDGLIIEGYAPKYSYEDLGAVFARK